MKTNIALALMLAFGGVAVAQPAGSGKAPDPKAGSAAKAPAPKKEDAAKMKAPEPPKMEMKPAPEIAEMAKTMAGNWKCTGKVAMDPANPANMTDFKGTFKAALDLDKYWVKGEWASMMGKIKNRGVMYMTYDAAAKKWYRHAVDNMGMGVMEWSTGLPAGAKEGKMVWEGDSHMMGMMMKGRTTEELAAKSVTMTSEMSMDGGKKWVTGMTMTCKK
ncbi:MAG: DUF1579 family protein [Myxococcota bacterium]|nr:DUF1579 family protein [Myxococcota bacterium]